MSKGLHIAADADETIVWRHSPTAPKSNQGFSFLGLGPAFWIQVFFLIPLWVFFIFKIWMGGGFDFSNGQYWTETRNIKQIAFVGISSLWLLVLAGKIIAKRNEQLEPIIAVPVEMTNLKILVNRNDGYGPSEVDIGSIKTAALDYAEGALAVKLKTSHEDITLISSEARNLLKQLYGLRPDLEGGS